MPRPLLLLDVGGVLCPMGPGGDAEMVECHAGVSSVRYATVLPTRLAALGERFVPVWCTGWGEEANVHLAPRFGLPELPVIDFGEAVADPTASRKLDAVRRWVRRRPFAWVDDELGAADHAWAATREAPTMLVDCDPRTGLLDEHVERLLAFAEDVP